MGDTMQFSSAGSSSSLSPASLQHASGTRRPRPSSRAGGRSSSKHARPPPTRGADGAMVAARRSPR